jgi:hypothetical protein
MERVGSSDHWGIENFAKLCRSHRLNSKGGKRFVYKQHLEVSNACPNLSPVLTGDEPDFR